jgi:hypothetical protein
MNNDTETTMFPPWGQQNISDIEATQENLGVPSHWKVNENLDNGTRRNLWNEFVTQTLERLGETLWPLYNLSKGSWRDGAETQMFRLTEADFNIMLKLQAGRPHVIDNSIESPLSGPVLSSHLKHFDREDASALGRMHAEYDFTLPPRLLAAVPTLMREGLDHKSASTAKQFKRHLQRPRPYQMALRFGIRNFGYRHANSAASPSMISGHAISGLIATGTVIDRWLKDKEDVHPKSFEALQQYAVDVGDRRVYAGVHYPSDNLSSWITSMILAKEVFEVPETRAHLWSAIHRSTVYNLIARSGDPAYQPALDHLQSLEPQ